MNLRLIALCFAFVTSTTALIGFTQSSGVRGKLMCNDKPASGVTVKLFDEDDLPGDLDDLLQSGKTSSNGEFNLAGHTDEATPIDPKLVIFHDCNDGIKPCQRKVTIKIPNRYITKGKVPKQIYDAGSIQLSGKFPGEGRDCIH
uniref:Transthyretin-like family protein n=1 Tax=Rhabditophanes sp. KR3021 TaxID=114890 RepID=A0AC35U8R9_9BILA